MKVYTVQVLILSKDSSYISNDVVVFSSESSALQYLDSFVNEFDPAEYSIEYSKYSVYITGLYGTRTILKVYEQVIID